jgi:ferrous iron transport protein A
MQRTLQTAPPRPLTDVGEGQTRWLAAVSGPQAFRRALEDMGFVAGAKVTVVCRSRRDMVVQLCESRLAVGSETAGRLMVTDSPPEEIGV